MSNPKILAAWLGAATLISPALVHAGQDPVACAYANSPIAVDGDLADWGRPLSYVKDWKSTVGIRSDNKNLYICFSISDRGLRRQALMGGLTVWIDPHGGKKEILGIRYPMPMVMPVGLQAPGEMPGMGDEGGGLPGMGSGTGRDTSGARGRPWNANRSRFRPRLTDVEVLGPGKDEKHWFQVDSLRGLAVKIAMAPESLVYELRIPLTASGDNSCAAGAEPGSIIGLGLQTGAMQLPERAARMQRGGAEGSEGEGGDGGDGGGAGFGGRGRRGGGVGGMPGGGGGLPGGGPESGGFGGRAGRNIQQVKIDDWIKVQLATEGAMAAPSK